MTTNPMTVEEVENFVKKIEQSKGDFEAAHSMEDMLYVAVLYEISQGHSKPQQLAQAALKALKVDFNRYTA